MADLKDEKTAGLDLTSIGDAELLDLLDRVSAEVKRRNGLLPKTSGSAMVDILKAIGDAARPGRHG